MLLFCFYLHTCSLKGRETETGDSLGLGDQLIQPNWFNARILSQKLR